MIQQSASKPHVVVVGGGFAGVECVKKLRKAPVRVTLIDKHNHHLFQPLLYQVATAALSPANIAAPIREVFADDANVFVMLDEATGIDAERMSVSLASGGRVRADTIVVATGLVPVYFGNNTWRDHAPPLKTIDDALEIRRKFLLAFERAELQEDEAARRSQLTFVVIGGGPTGVEMAGALAELARKTLRSEFRNIDPASARVILVEGQDRVLPGMHEDSSNRALKDLHALGVEVVLGVLADQVDDAGVTLSDGQRLAASNVIWAAGIGGEPLGRQTGGPLARDGRVEVDDDLTVPGHRDLFVVGDLARVVDDRSGKEVPGVAPAALQMGAFVGNTLRREFTARARSRRVPARRAFKYLDKGTLATIGRDKAVAEVFGQRFGGLVAYLLWAFVHIYFLVGYRNRLLTMLQWVWHYLRYDRSARLITANDRAGASA